MPITALLGTKPARLQSMRSVLAAAKREFDRGRWGRGLVLVGLLVLVRTGTVLDALRAARPAAD